MVGTGSQDSHISPRTSSHTVWTRSHRCTVAWIVAINIPREPARHECTVSRAAQGNSLVPIRPVSRLVLCVLCVCVPCVLPNCSMPESSCQENAIASVRHCGHRSFNTAALRSQRPKRFRHSRCSLAPQLHPLINAIFWGKIRGSLSAVES